MSAMSVCRMSMLCGNFMLVVGVRVGRRPKMFGGPLPSSVVGNVSYAIELGDWMVRYYCEKGSS